MLGEKERGLGFLRGKEKRQTARKVTSQQAKTKRACLEKASEETHPFLKQKRYERGWTERKHERS